MLQNYFEKYGHQCKLDLNKSFHKFLVNKSNLRKWYMEHAVISQDRILLRSRPRSHAALRREILYQLEYYPWALHPFSEIMYYFDIVWMLVIFIWLIVRPYRILKQIHLSGTTHEPEYLELFSASICLLLCIPRFLQGYYIKKCDGDEIVLDVRRTSLKYIKTYFWIDLISAMAVFGCLGFQSIVKYYLFLRLLSILIVFRLGTVIQVMKNIMRYYRLNYYLIEIFTAAAIVFFLVHIISCFSVLPGIIQRRFNPKAYVWFEGIIEDDMKVFDKYIICLHRTFSMLIGAGYDVFKVEKKSVYDMIYTILTTIAGHILLMTTFAKIYEIIHCMRSASAKYDEMISEISNYMHHHNISKKTDSRIKTYYAFKYENSYYNEHRLLVSIPTHLRDNILMHSSTLLLDNIQLFRKLPIALAANIVSYLAKEIFLPGDVLYRSGEIGKTMYFLLSGAAASFTNTGREIQHFEDGSEFGERAFPGERRGHLTTIVVIEKSEIFKLPLKDYITLIGYCPDLVEQIDKATNERRDFAELAEERFYALRNRMITLNEQPDRVQKFEDY